MDLLSLGKVDSLPCRDWPGVMIHFVSVALLRRAKGHDHLPLPVYGASTGVYLTRSSL